MKVRIKKLNKDAVTPEYAMPGDAGMDLYAVSRERDEFGNEVYHTGLAFEIPEGYVGLLFPRSSVCKKDMYLTNSVGVIDSGYRGEVTFKYRPVQCYHNPEVYRAGERVGQIMILPYPQVEFEEVRELSTTARQEGGYGSTGR